MLVSATLSTLQIWVKLYIDDVSLNLSVRLFTLCEMTLMY